MKQEQIQDSRSNMSKMSVLKVELLLWYYYSPNDYPNFDAPAVQYAIDEFCKAGVFRRITKDENSDKKIWYNQSALDVYVHEVLSIPVPTQIWVCQK